MADSPRDPRMVKVDLTTLMLEGVLMVANESFFWPLGLALTWDVDPVHGDREHGTVRDGSLHVTEWQYEDGHMESIGLEAGDQIAIERRARFADWLAARAEAMPDAEGDRAALVESIVREHLGATPVV